MMKNLHCQQHHREKHGENHAGLSENMSVQLHSDPQMLACEVFITSIPFYFAMPKGWQIIICSDCRNKIHFFQIDTFIFRQKSESFLNGKT